MKVSPATSACRACRFYTPEGRRGGFCQQLSVPVRGSWQACSLAISPFAPSWEGMEEILIWQQEMAILRERLPLEDGQVEVGPLTNSSNSTQPTVKVLAG
ncbi:MAG TPA: hypothetical protein V6D28_18825 [Leptolyngbyaceae cyanobacterium]